MTRFVIRGLLYDQICYTRYLPPGDVPYVRMRLRAYALSCVRARYVYRLTGLRIPFRLTGFNGVVSITLISYKQK